MGKKGKRSRRRGEKGRVMLPPGTRPYTGYLPSNVTADDLDDDTAKPRAPLLAPELHYHEKHGIPYDDPVDRRAVEEEWYTLSSADRKAAFRRAEIKQATYDNVVDFCSLSGMGLTAENFVDSCETPPVVQHILGLIKHGVDTGGDKNALEYLVTKQEELNKASSRGVRRWSLRMIRARACGDKRAAKKAEKWSYKPVREEDFNEEQDNMRFNNGRVIADDDWNSITKRLMNLMGPDDKARSEYLTLVLMRRVECEGLSGALRAAKKWIRVRPYWRRIRRRICQCCYKQADLSEPRYLVCSGCGEVRYCSEACQRAHWAKHQEECPAGQPGWNAAEDDEALARRLQREWEEEDNRPRRVDSL